MYAADKTVEKLEIKIAEAGKEGAEKSVTSGLDFASANSYYGQEITPDTILKMAPKPNEKLTEDAQKYLKDHPGLIKLFSGSFYYEPLDSEKFGTVTPYNLSFYPQETEKDKDAKAAFQELRTSTLKAAGIDPAKLPGSNYTVDLNDDWLIKASSRANRVENINSSVGNPYGATVTPQQLEAFKKMTGGGKTYQTISRLAYWLRLREAKKELKLNRICLPKQYLVHIPGRPTEVEDQNYVIVERKIKGGRDFKDSPLAVDKELMKQLTWLIGYAALWDLSDHNILIKDGKACMIDVEQPNVHKPLEFFHKNTQTHRSNVDHGWAEVRNRIIKPYADKEGIDTKPLLDDIEKIYNAIKKTWQSK
jgi:hypothetical protein